MIKVGIQTYKGTGHSGRGIGVYGDELIGEISKLENIEVVEFGTNVKEIAKQVDLVHFLHFDLFEKTLSAKLPVPMVVTVHDVTPLIFPEHYPSGIRGKIKLFWQRNSLKRADRIITISENSKKDITRYLGIKADKIDVVYSGVSKRFKKINDRKKMDETKKKYNLPDKFAFYSGNVNWNKNILNTTLFCLEAGLDLVIVGKSFESRENLDHPEMKSYKEFLGKYANNPKVHILGYVPDDEMVVILNQASVSVFLSYYEGFGFPILEAQACGVPVITSNVSAMPEIGGKGAILISPDSKSDFLNAVSKIMNEAEYKENLINEGYENMQKFSWEKCAEETVEVYREIIQ